MRVASLVELKPRMSLRKPDSTGPCSLYRTSCTLLSGPFLEFDTKPTTKDHLLNCISHLFSNTTTIFSLFYLYHIISSPATKYIKSLLPSFHHHHAIAFATLSLLNSSLNPEKTKMNFLRCFCIEDFPMGKSTHSGFFSTDLLPSLGANFNRTAPLKKYTVSPFDRRYRTWEMFLVILVVYSAWISPFDFAFLDDKQGALRIFDNIVNGFFAIDIVLTFFVAYLDSQSYVVVDDHKKIAMRYLSTWFMFDVSSTVPFRSLSLLCTDRKTEIGFKVLSMLRLWRLRRVSSLFARLEKDIRFNYFWIRCTKLTSVSH